MSVIRAAEYLDTAVTNRGVPTLRGRTMEEVNEAGQIAKSYFFLDYGVTNRGVPTLRMRSHIQEEQRVFRAYLDEFGVRRWRSGSTLVCGNFGIWPEYLSVTFPETLEPWGPAYRFGAQITVDSSAPPDLDFCTIPVDLRRTWVVRLMIDECGDEVSYCKTDANGDCLEPESEFIHKINGSFFDSRNDPDDPLCDSRFTLFFSAIAYELTQQPSGCFVGAPTHLVWDRIVSRAARVPCNEDPKPYYKAFPIEVASSFGSPQVPNIIVDIADPQSPTFPNDHPLITRHDQRYFRTGACFCQAYGNGAYRALST